MGNAVVQLIENIESSGKSIESSALPFEVS